MSLLLRISQSRWSVLLWALALFCACFVLNTRNNRFPYYYHPDEPGKVEQLMEEKWNFHHPMLLLSSTELATNVLNTPEDEQPIVETGRYVSAAWMALAVVALSLLGYLWRGWTAAIAAGLALGVHHQLYELSHYLKEDSALLAGVALAFLASYAYAQAPSIPRAALVGAACAIAISGKYIGAAVLVVALPALLQKRANGADTFPWKKAIAAAAIAFVAALVVVNWPVLRDLQTFRTSFQREVSLVATGQGEVTRSIPHALYWNVFVDNTSPIIWILLAIFLVARWEHRSGMNWTERLLVLFPFAFAVALSFSPKENDRYFLPATAMFTLFAAMAVEETPKFVVWLAELFGMPRPERWIEQRGRGIVIAIAVTIFVAVQLWGWWPTKPGWLQYDQAFQKDDQAELLAWLQTKLPPDAVIAADSRVGLPNPARKKHAERVAAVRQKLIVAKQVSDIGTLEDLRKKGVTHVAVSESSYGRFFRGNLRAKEQKEKRFQQGRAFYEQLFREGYRIFDRDRGTVIYLHPGILVYRIVDGDPGEPLPSSAG